MIDSKLLGDLADRISAFVAASPVRDLEKNLKAYLTASLGRLDLVTREEFDLQRQALAEARAQLAALEAQVAALERRAAEHAPPPRP